MEMTIEQRRAVAVARARQKAETEVPSQSPDEMRQEMISQEKGQMIAPFKGASAGIGNIMFGGQKYLGKGLQMLGAQETGQALIEDAARRRAQAQAEVAPYREQFPTATGAGEFVGEVAATAPVGGVLAAPFRGAAALSPTIAKVATPVAQSLSSGGFRTGVTSAPANLVLRTGAGATVGGISAGLVDPEATEFGAILGAAMPTAVSVIAKGGAKTSGWLTDLMKGRLADVKAGAVARATLGDNLPAAITALSNAKPGITATQALADAGINADPFMALGELAKKNDVGSWYRLLNEAQKAAQKNQLALTAGGPTQVAARAATDEALNSLTKSTTPMRENALARANVGGTITKAVNPEIASFTSAGSFTGQGVPKALGQAQAQLDALSAHGLKPIDTDKIVSNITFKLSDPKIGPSDVNQSVLSKVASKIKEWTEKGGGVIDADALYSIRKNAVGEEIARLYPNADAKQQARYAAKLLNEVKPLIDDAIETAGGTGWGRYLRTYETGMKGVEQNKMGAEALRMFNESPKEFIKLMQGNNPKAVEDIFGPGSYDIIKEMGRKSAPMEDVARALQRDIDIGEQAKAGTGGLKRIMESEQSLFRRIPAYFSRTTTTANMTLDVLEGKVNQKTLKVFENGFKSGKNAAEMLSELPTSERNRVLNLLSNSKKWSASVTRAGGISAVESQNNLAPEQQNRNSLRP
jgi:hypothetical protein